MGNISQRLAASGALKQKTNIKVSPHFSLTGGINVQDSPMEIPPGELLGCQNFEPSILGGYRRFDGYERFDGQQSPSDASYVTVQFMSAFNPTIGDTLTESGSGATGIVAYVDTANSNVVFVNVSGLFVGDGSVFTGGGTSKGAPYINSAQTQALADAYWYQKWLYFQAFIGPVGGASCSGPVRGAFPYKANVYAFRDSADGTEGTFWQSSGASWVQVPLGTKIYYEAGVYADGAQDPIPEGTVLTGATSGATFTVRRVATLLGTWGLDAKGYIITDAITGTPTANELLKVGATTYATYVTSVAQTLPPGGQYKYRTYNFDAVQTPTTGFRLYCINGVGNGIEYDDSGVFTVIETGMTPDIPTNLEIHESYLFYSYAGGSLQNSGYQDPLSWNPVFGADARQVGEDVTFLREDVSQTLVIGTRRNIWMLTGLQTEQFQVQVYAANTGAIANTDENPGQMIVGEDRGITLVSAAAQYGNFAAGSLTDKILKLILPQFQTDTVIGAIVTRAKNLYRLVFASGAVYSLAINAQGQFSGWLTGSYSHLPTCISCGFTRQTNQPQVERAFFGDGNGYVYELDKGRSFDGLIVDFFLKLSYWHVGSPSVYKRFRYLQLDMAPEGSASIFVGADCDYGNRAGMTSPTYGLGGGGGLWDIAKWDEFIWDAPTYTGVQLKLELEGYNVSTVISGAAINDVPFTVSGGLYQYSPRIINRNTGV